MKNIKFNGKLPMGSIVALVTPFLNGKVDFEKLGKLIDFHAEAGTDGIVLLGTTGESSTLSSTEKAAIVDFGVRRANNKIFVFAGSGSNDTAAAVAQSRQYAGLGVDALLVVTPYYNKTNGQGMLKHFFSVADSSQKPVVLYNVPSRTGCAISVESLSILKTHQNIVGIKEASGDMSFAAEVACLTDENFCMYSGNDDIIVPMLSLGAIGVISVWANICPKECNLLTRYWFEGKTNISKNIQLKYLRLIKLLFEETNPIPIKAALKYLGADSGECRLPLCEMQTGKEKLFAEIDKLQIKLAL